ncbi:MAG: biotin--[acetyl-CoA-carboxylase] ligase [Clostridiales bacterium]|uniref:biotin--[acetyl-CoA-carboxylase] ligase n=1 Tax=Clostridium sp. N3C TaxID=1776758 RepID=UPI00092E1160|nr:biotin--[acetyl-CoA-carboxylase] ligase [Clostridium sp. N3C]NLZ48373.1 biotin--[acetyl-CoA-carboxylase] ligase [Clostridiales bacterium]SCN26486.1 Bifunctional protein BirA [Clostridium sp. N3C]
MKDKILNLLSEDEYISGESISASLGISRAAVWKYINALKLEGYKIESSTKKGYLLLNRPDILSSAEIQPLLKTQYIGKNIFHFQSINSTNLKAKELANNGCPNGTVIISEEQSSGRGRLGRDWISPYGKGIWMSIILKPEIPPMEAYKVTIIGAAAVHSALLENGLSTLIKWPNDIVVEGKKICGILTEMNGELNKIHSLIIGIGINVNVDLSDIPMDLKDKASSLKILAKKDFSRKIILASLLNHFESLYDAFINTGSIEDSLYICRKYSAVINKEVLLMEGRKSTKVKVKDISNNGHLIVQDGATLREVISGEVSLRCENSYI